MTETLPPSPNHDTSTAPQRARDDAADWLDRALSRHGAERAEAYIDDGGFTASVMARLPARIEPLRWRKPVVMLLWAIAAAGVAVTMPSTVLDVARGAVRLFAGRPFALSDAATLLALAGAALWGATWLVWRRA